MKRLVPEYSDKESRRILTQLFTARVEQVNVTEAPHGAILGNHFHKSTKEYFYVIRGSMKYNNKEMLKKGDLFMVEPHERHTLKVLSDKATFITFLSEPYNVDSPDLHK